MLAMYILDNIPKNHHPLYINDVHIIMHCVWARVLIIEEACVWISIGAFLKLLPH